MEPGGQGTREERPAHLISATLVSGPHLGRREEDTPREDLGSGVWQSRKGSVKGGRPSLTLETFSIPFLPLSFDLRQAGLRSASPGDKGEGLANGHQAVKYLQTCRQCLLPSPAISLPPLPRRTTFPDGPAVLRETCLNLLNALQAPGAMG